MSDEFEITSTINEVSEILNFLADSFDNIGNTYMYEVLSELSDTLQACNKEINKQLYTNSSLEITNNILKNIINK